MGESKRDKKKSKKFGGEVDLVGLEPESHEVFGDDGLEEADPRPAKPKKGSASTKTAKGENAKKSSPDDKSNTEETPRSSKKSKDSLPMTDDLMAVVDSLLPEPISPPSVTSKKNKRSHSSDDESASPPKKSNVAAASLSSSKKETPKEQQYPNIKPVSSPHPQGAYDPETQEWMMELSGKHRLRVGKLRGRPFVDIRAYQNGAPTYKGVFLSVDDFRKLMAWDGLENALAATANSTK